MNKSLDGLEKFVDSTELKKTLKNVSDFTPKAIIFSLTFNPNTSLTLNGNKI